MQLLIFLISYPILMGLSLLPYPLLYGLSNVLSLLIHRFFRFRLTVVRKNLKLSFPEMSDKERSVIEKQFYRHFCDVFLEMIKNLTISEKQIKKRFKFINIDLINRCEEQKQSTILLLGHYSNWEGMLSIGYHFKGKAYGIYSPLSNKYFNRLITKSREKHRAYLVSRYQTINFIRESVKKGKFALYGFINDQSPQPKPKNYWRDFMGVKVPVFTGAERMAKEFNFPVYYTEIKRVKRGYYTATISLLKENPSECTANEITDLFTEKLEEQIRRDPAQYLWSHNRFKHAYLAPK